MMPGVLVYDDYYIWFLLCNNSSDDYYQYLRYHITRNDFRPYPDGYFILEQGDEIFE